MISKFDNVISPRIVCKCLQLETLDKRCVFSLFMISVDIVNCLHNVSDSDIDSLATIEQTLCSNFNCIIAFLNNSSRYEFIRME